MPALDGLRAAAVIAVLLFHAGHLQGGFLGVDLFFALSGFLITSLLLRDAEQGSVRLLGFWGRRFRRLLPAVFLLIGVVALWAWVAGSPAELDGVRRTGGWALGYMANWHFIGEAGGYWVSFDRPSMFDHLWSLAIEEQFYVAWPLVVLVVWKVCAASSPAHATRRMHQALLAISLGGVAASFVAMLALHSPGSDPTRVYMGTDTRAASILIGAALATAPARRLAKNIAGTLGARADRGIAALGLALGLSWIVVDGASSATLYRGGLLLHSITAAVLVTALATLPRGRAAHLFSWRPLVWVGVRSYGLYLWHWPVYVVLSSERTGIDGATLTLLRIAVATALAAASFRFVEDPIRHRATWVRDRRGIPALAGAVAVVAATLIVLPHPRREIAAFDPATIAAPAAGRHAPSQMLGPPPPATVGQPAPSSTAEPTSTRPLPSTTVATAIEASRTVPPTSTTVPATSTTTTTTTTPAAVADTAGALATFSRPVTRVMWTGDSIAYDLAPGVGAALTGAGIRAESTAYLGMRLVGDGQFALLPRLRTLLPSAGADVIVVQLSLWDADADPVAQTSALDELHGLVVGGGSRLVLVQPPPTVDTAKDQRLAPMVEHARSIAAADPASTLFLDSSAVWGPA
ncbi:MAG: acyltransferase family protein, partial [Ilumatobacteraceae bacterium]